MSSDLSDKIQAEQLKQIRLQNRLLREQIKTEKAKLEDLEEESFDFTSVDSVIGWLWDKAEKLIDSPAAEKFILSAIFIYAWKEAYGDEFKLTDIPIGILYGFTIPDALKGSEVSNLYAVGALTALGLGFEDDVLPGWAEIYPISASPAYAAWKVFQHYML